jgi:hypothetical protein
MSGPMAGERARLESIHSTSRQAFGSDAAAKGAELEAKAWGSLKLTTRPTLNLLLLLCASI